MSDFWNEQFSKDEYIYGTLPNVFLKAQLEKLNPGKILFICEGEGRNAVCAAQLNWETFAFDSSEVGQKKALRLAKEHGVKIQYIIGDATNIEFEHESFDAIASIFAHFIPEKRQSIHKKLVAWLKPDGHLIMEAFNPEQLSKDSGGPSRFDMLYSKEMLKDDFTDLCIAQLSYENTILNEGSYHIGEAEVIRFVGKKMSL